MTPLAPHLTAFFQQRLPLERRPSTREGMPRIDVGSGDDPSHQPGTRDMVHPADVNRVTHADREEEGFR